MVPPPTHQTAIQVLPLVSAGIIVVRELVRQQKVRMAKAMMQAAAAGRRLSRRASSGGFSAEAKAAAARVAEEESSREIDLDSVSHC